MKYTKGDKKLNKLLPVDLVVRQFVSVAELDYAI